MGTEHLLPILKDHKCEKKQTMARLLDVKKVNKQFKRRDQNLIDEIKSQIDKSKIFIEQLIVVDH